MNEEIICGNNGPFNLPETFEEWYSVGMCDNFKNILR